MADDTRVSYPTYRRLRRTTAGGTTIACLAMLWASAVPAAAERGRLRWAPVAPAGVSREAGAPTARQHQASAPTPAGIASLDKALDQAELASVDAAEELFQAAANAVSVEIAIDEAAGRADLAREALTERVRKIYMAGEPDPMSRLFLGLRQSQGLASVASAGVASDQSLASQVERESRGLDRLRHQAVTAQTTLTAKARQVSTLADRALELLTSAQLRYADDQMKLAALELRKQEIKAKEEAVQRAVAARAAELPGVTPTVTARGQDAGSAQAPIIAALEAAGAGFPAGYRATGRKLTGNASWYGPGFYGKPTASGAPYDAERFTCAMLAVPLGTVVRVTTDAGKTVNVLVNDRGPYVDGRIIDNSAAGSRMLGYSGVAHVTVEVLEPIP